MDERDGQLTLVAWLGAKPEALARVLIDCQESIGAALGDAFERSSLEQIHATVVGLERVPGTHRDNANMIRLRGRREAMDIEGFLATLRDDPELPLQVRFGGFARGARPLTSRRRTPWERTFSIQGDKAVLLGWPVLFDRLSAGRPTPDRFPATVERLRRRAEDFNILHAYHRTPEDADNDLYLRLGTVRGANEIRHNAIANVETVLRDAMASRAVTVPLSLDDLGVALYRDPALPPASTRVIQRGAQLVGRPRRNDL